MSIYKRAGSKFFWCDFWISGHHVQKSTGFTSKRLALEYERELRVNIETEHRRAGGSAAAGNALEGSLNDLLQADAEEVKSHGVTSGTIRGLEYAHARIREFFTAERFKRDPSARDINHESCTAYVAHRRGSGARGQSIVRELQCLKRIVGVARRRGWILREPTSWPKIKRDPKDMQRAGKLIPAEDLKRWFEALPTQDARDYAALLMMTGLRREELGRLRFSDVNGAQLVLRAEASKTGARVVPLPVSAQRIIERRSQHEKRVRTGRAEVFEHYLNKVRPGEAPAYPATVSFNKVFMRAAKAVQLSYNIHPRDLRHTFASLVARKDPVAAMRLLGHKDLKTTEIYSSTTEAWLSEASDAAAKQLPSPYTGSLQVTRAEGSLGAKWLTQRRIYRASSKTLVETAALRISCSTN